MSLNLRPGQIDLDVLPTASSVPLLTTELLQLGQVARRSGEPSETELISAPCADAAHCHCAAGLLQAWVMHSWVPGGGGGSGSHVPESQMHRGGQLAADLNVSQSFCAGPGCGRGGPGGPGDVPHG